MNNQFKFKLLLIAVLASGPLLARAAVTDSLRFGMFGQVTIYKPAGEPKSVVLFVSGDGGWNSGVVDMAKHFCDQGALVAGINILTYYKGVKSLTADCCYPAGDFEELSLMIQRKYKLPEYLKPILTGYSSGATLVYGILVQAPAGTFRGAIALGFCPDIEISKPLCSGSGLKQHVIKQGVSWYLEASDRLTAPFIALHGIQDQVCPFDATREYMKKVSMGEIVELPKAGHGFSVPSSWLPQFIAAYRKILSAPSFAEQKMKQDSLRMPEAATPPSGGFPLALVPAPKSDTLPLGFMISGDGGWTGFDYAIARGLADKGIPVIGLDAQKYFWKFRSPDETTAEVAKAIKYYMQQWGRKSFILTGYSYGGCVIPFLASRLPADLQDRLMGVVCLSPDETVDFEVHITDMIGIGRAADSFRVPDEIRKIERFHPVCLFGDGEEQKLRTLFSQAGARVVTIPGNHHYNNKPVSVAEAIFTQVTKQGTDSVKRY